MLRTLVNTCLGEYISCFLIYIYFGVTPSIAQGLLLALCSGLSPGGTWGINSWCQGLSCAKKAILHTGLFLQPLYTYIFWVRGIPDNDQGSFMALHSGITTDNARGTRWDANDQTLVCYIQRKHPIYLLYYLSSTPPMCIFLRMELFLRICLNPALSGTSIFSNGSLSIHTSANSVYEYLVLLSNTLLVIF